MQTSAKQIRVVGRHRFKQSVVRRQLRLHVQKLTIILNKVYLETFENLFYDILLTLFVCASRHMHITMVKCNE
jgi:hypothetical protein